MKYKFICPLFRIEVRLLVGDKKKLKVDWLYENCYCAITSTVTKDNGVLEYITVWVEKANDYNSMVHETVHLTKRIFEMMGIPFNETNDEIIAYYQNYWVRKFWNKMSSEIKV